ncbi:MAG: hypothetical protein WBE98_01030 [Gammaproteobacteria bacterium]
MTARLAALAAVLLVSTSGAARADDESDGVLPALEACTDALHELASSRGDPPSGRLGDVCAELAAELDDRVWGEALVSTSAEDLSVPAFGELGQLIAHYERPRSDPSGLDVDELARIVESLGALEPVVELSPWQRIVRFVRERLGLDDDGNAGDWLAWLRRVGLPENWQRGIVVTLGMLAAVFVIVVVANELAARRAASGERGAGAGTAPLGRVLGVDDIERAAPASQPALLLSLLLARLRERFGDAVRESMTPRELAAAVGALGLSRRDDFGLVAEAAERVVFAGWRPEAADAAVVLARARAVLDELDGNAVGQAARGR